MLFRSECVSGVGYLLSGNSRSCCGRSRGSGSSRGCCRCCGRGCCRCGCDSAVAAWSCRSRRPVGIAPAQFVGAVLPDEIAGTVLPVVYSLCASGGCERCRGKQHRHFVQFLHGSPLGEKAAAALRIRTLRVTTTKNVKTIVPYVTGEKRLYFIRHRRTKPQ